MTISFKEKLFGKIVEWMPILLLYLVMGIIFIIITGIVVSTGEPKPAWEGEPVYETRVVTQSSGNSKVSSYINTWLRWDTGYYLKIAALGYDREDGTLAFPPLYPMIIQAFRKLTGGDYISIGLIVSNIFCVITLVLLYEIALAELGERLQVQLAVIFFLTYPAGFYLFAAYTESLFMTLALATWLFVRKRFWIFGGLTASLAILTRYQGIILVFLFLWVCINDKRTELDHDKVSREGYKQSNIPELQKNPGGRIINSPLLATLLPIVVISVFAFWLKIANGVSMFQARQTVNNPITNPFIGISAVVTRLRNGDLILMDWINLFSFTICVLLSIFSFRKINLAFSYYSITTILITAWISFGISASDVYKGQIFVSFLRYSLSLFPLFIFAGGIYRKRIFVVPIVGSFLAIQIFLVWLFLQWYWVA